jgi:hypothetical protein
MSVKITDIENFTDLIYECFNGIDVTPGEYIEALIKSTKPNAISRFISETKSIPDEEEDSLELAAIQAEIIAKHIFTSFDSVFVENDVCFAMKDKAKTVIYKDMSEFNWFE